MTLAHGNNKWQLQDLRQALKREIGILESGLPTLTPEIHPSTTSFNTGTGSNPMRARRDLTTSDRRPTEYTPRCEFCSDDHFANNCMKVTTTQERKKIVILKQLCFHCLGNHQVATCRSSIEYQPGPKSSKFCTSSCAWRFQSWFHRFHTSGFSFCDTV